MTADPLEVDGVRPAVARVAALPAMPDRTATQIVNAVTSKLKTLK